MPIRDGADSREGDPFSSEPIGSEMKSPDPLSMLAEPGAGGLRGRGPILDRARRLVFALHRGWTLESRCLEPEGGGIPSLEEGLGEEGLEGPEGGGIPSLEEGNLEPRLEKNQTGRGRNETERGLYQTYDLPRLPSGSRKTRSRLGSELDPELDFGPGEVRLGLEELGGRVDFESTESLSRGSRALKIGLSHFLGMGGSPGAREFAEGVRFLGACRRASSRRGRENRSLFAEKGSDAIGRLLVDRDRLGGTESTLLEIIGCGGTESGSVTLWIPKDPRVSERALSDLLDEQPQRLRELVLELVGLTKLGPPRSQWGREEEGVPDDRSRPAKIGRCSMSWPPTEASRPDSGRLAARARRAPPRLKEKSGGPNPSPPERRESALNPSRRNPSAVRGLTEDPVPVPKVRGLTEDPVPKGGA